MRPRSPHTGGALRRATGVLYATIVVLLLAGCAQQPRPIRADPVPERTQTAAPDPPAEGPRAADAPVRIRIDAIDVDAPVVRVGLRADGSMETPSTGLAGWYGPGPAPGAPGPAVVVAHVDSTAGPDVFHQLRLLDPGDRIRITDDGGRVHRFAVTHLEQHDKDALPTDRVWNDTEQRRLRLVTCGGAFDDTTGHYEDNVIAFAVPAGDG